uniref:CSON004890 protein n=1 Tax=Culicoides sonorensis TaxID=179676 RepID=A0A336LIH5_CULSO
MINLNMTNEFPMAAAFYGTQEATNPQMKLLGWNLPPEEQHLVHPHWKGYQAPPFYMHLLLALIYFILMVTSTIGNGLVIWIFSTSKSLRSASNMFIVNLAIFDLLMMLEMPMFIANSFYERLLGYDLGCTIYAALGSLSGIGESTTNAVIAYDRYRTISRPLDGRLSKGQAGIFIAITWFWTMPFTLLPIFKIWGRYIPEGYLTTCSFDYLTNDQDTRVFVACIFVWAYCIPMVAISVCYMKLFGQVRTHERLLKEQAKKMNVKSLAANKEQQGKAVEIRIAKACFTIFFLFLCAWTPYAFVALTGAYGDRAELEKRLPWLGIKEKLDEGDNKSDVTAVSGVPDGERMASVTAENPE